MANGPKKACGVLIAIKDSVVFRHIHTIQDPQGRYIILICELNQVIFTLVNLYAPNTKQRKFLAPLFTKVAEVITLILGGDFNTVLDPSLDSTTSARKPVSSIFPLLHKYELYDIWRCLHGSERDFTFLSAAHSSYSHIDFFFTDKRSLQNVLSASIGTISWSDHAPITLQFDTKLRNTPPPLWRLNTSLLEDKVLCQKIVKEHHDFFNYNDSPEMNRFTLWNAYKVYMRGVLIKMASYVKRQRMKQISDLLHAITLKERDNKLKPDPQLTQAILQDRQQLWSLLLYKHENNLKYLKASYYGLHNKAGAWLARKVKAKQVKQKIDSLTHHLTHKTLSNPKDIANTFADYYQS